MKEKIINSITGEEIWRDYTEAEIEKAQAIQAEADKKIAEIAAKETAKITLLEKLGLTEEEAKLLLS